MTNRENITGNDFKRMIAGAYSLFYEEHERINSLNVFPVPDGDTGTNMLRTLGAAAKAVREADEEGIGSLAKRAADSAIMGARGNSGVILSQIFRGLGRGLAGKEAASSDGLGKAFQYGVLYAYRAVAKPVEGTILTVAKGIAKGAYQAVRSDLPIEEILEAAIAAGKKELLRTPDLLPALKAAGVVDAGGTGLIVFLEGCLRGLGCEFAAPDTDFEMAYKAKRLQMQETDEFDTAHPYCTEFIVKNTKAEEREIKSVLAEMGDSLIVVKDEDMLKVHIHTDHPGLVLENAVGWGTLHDIKIDNMADQHRAKPSPSAEKPLEKLGIIAVAAGKGMEKIMQTLGAAIIVAGGQSMNPSVEEFIEAVHQEKAEKYIILPNNKNIILSTLQVKKLLGDRVEIVPTANMAEGIAAIMSYDAEKPLQENVQNMESAAKKTKEAAVTIAVRDSTVDGKTVTEGSFIGISGGRVKITGKNLVQTLLDTLALLIDADSEIISLYYGRDIDEITAEKAKLAITEKWQDIELEMHDGGQPTYYFIASVE
jgi:hypothetical protein